MALEANSWRYENMKAKKGFSCLKNMEILKIKRDDAFADREHAEELMKKDNFKSYWRENMEHTANSHKIKKDLQLKKTEIKLSGQASMLVRKAALKKLLEDEYAQHQVELNQQNKAFYIKRE
ncbi:hypothetical protein LSAT2_012224 [Lamellibrachia satsuma]|nr:hypothetical protein LSAT2_012224 [Lamellibrachia satsuma]